MDRRSREAAFSLSVLAAGLLLVADSTKLAGQSKTDSKDSTSQLITNGSKHSGPFPLAEFGRASMESAADLLHRQSKESRYQKTWPIISDPGKFVNDSQESSMLTIIDTVYVESPDPFPTAFSSAVIVGTVMSARGFVSHDRTYVYSDFEVRLDEILKQDRKEKLSLGQRVIVSRAGAIVRFPSGHIKKFVILGQGMPKVGTQYLLNLWKPDPDFFEFEILGRGAFELVDGHANPLDDHSQTELEGIAATSLLAMVKNQIVKSPRSKE